MYFLANNDYHATYVVCYDIFYVHVCFAFNAIPYSAKLWRIWQILSNSPKFYPAKNAFRKFYESAITVYKY